MQNRQAPFYVSGNFAPVPDERDGIALQVEGELPRALSGRYVRNGPNPKSGVPPHWFFGDGMLHGIRLEDGEAVWYRNRWVKTPRLSGGVQPGPPDFRSGGPANTHIIRHAKKYLALVEGSLPTEVDQELNTLGVYDFAGGLQTPMTAHPKICPKTGELLFFGYGFRPPFVTYYRADAAGAILYKQELQLPAAVMMHDFAITERYAIFMDLPIVFDHTLLGKGMPFRWSDTHQARVGVLPREGGALRWFDIAPCFVFHVMNAFEAQERIHIDTSRFPQLPGEGNPPATLHRWTLDLRTGQTTETTLDAASMEFPRIDERRTGQPYRYGYAVHYRGEEMSTREATLIKYDLERRASVVQELGVGCVADEGVFVPAAADSAEDEGWVMSLVYDTKRDSSALVIVDAADFTRKPIAKILLPRRVPFGFHGGWFPDE